MCSSIAIGRPMPTAPARRRAESPPDVVHKKRIALKVRETRYWLRLAVLGELLDRTHLATLIDEADQLVAILIASANTARQRAERC